MEEKKQIILPTKRYSGAKKQELNQKVNLESSNTLLRIGERDIVLDVAKLFDTERNDSTKYKIYGKMKMVYRNMYSGNTEYIYLKDRLYLLGEGNIASVDEWKGWMPYDEFAFLRTDVLRNIDTPQTGSTIGGYVPQISLTGNDTGHTVTTTMTAPYKNWNLYLSYIISGDTSFPMKYTFSGNTYYSFTSGDGIPFRVTELNGDYVLTSPVPHGFTDGEYITLSGSTLTSGVTLTDKTFLVNSVGNEVYNSEKYVLTISKAQFKSSLYLTGSPIFLLGKRVLDINNILGTTSQYYVHKHKTLTNTTDYIMDHVGFESPIWENERKLLYENYSRVNDVLVERNRMESVLFDFKNPINISGLTNNLGYTVTEVYVSTIFRNSNGYFSYPPKVGYKFNFHDSWIDKHFDGTPTLEQGMVNNVTTFSPNSSQIGYDSFTGGTELNVGTILTGAYVEYNIKELKERVISESFHKFNTNVNLFDHGQTGSVSGFSGATTSNPFGLYYQVHHRVKLRELSPYIETANTNDIYNIPENALYDSDEGIWRWRDLYDHGYVDTDNYGTDFPFVNGQHYVKSDINFYLRNERYYNNKQDGITDFNNMKNIC